MPEAAATTQINVKYVNPQQPGKKNGSVKTDDGQMYFVPPEMLSQFEPGGRYNIQYKTSEFRGVKYHYVDKVARIAAPVPSTGPNAHNAMTKGTYGKVDMETAERIFVCGAYNAFLGNTNYDPRGLSVEDRIEEVNKNRAVWRATLGNPQQSAELNDEIPY